MNEWKNIGFVVNSRKPGAPALAEALIDVATNRGANIELVSDFPVPEDFLKDKDVCCVIGGDGTLLSVVSQASRFNVPIVGVNRGTLGFLTVFSADDAAERFEQLLRGEYHLSHRALLQCGDEPEDVALNDIVIKESFSSRLISLDVSVNGEWITQLSGDGLIFATPTGSTAYNLSAGGPIAHPDARVIAMTPICPHTLSNRTVIFDETVELSVRNTQKDHRLAVVLDGQRTLEIGTDQSLRIVMSPSKIALVQPPDYSHFGVLRAKLGWNSTAPAGSSPGSMRGR